MDLWQIIEWAAWALCVLFAALIVTDWIRTDRTYSEEELTSSREGEIEALTESAHDGRAP